ncbi:class I SAM-dependent methyltransferase [Mycolicibacterium moriokaense]|nr:class I SAM-dependent methyltransferase [Mycolicibacterium moriokaense]
MENRPLGLRRRIIRKLNAAATSRGQRFMYRYATRRLDGDDVVFLNYGYEEEPAMQVPLSADDERNRFFIQLYHRAATQVALAKKRVLEVGCGHGGGASYIMRTVHPASYVGLDLNPTGIAFCRTRHDLPGLEFVCGDAQNLPFSDQEFDAVINVESSHLYPRFPTFLTEVARVLRPGGHFLYTDARATYRVADWELALANAPMRMLSQRAINAEVVRGMEMNLSQWQYVIDRVAPAFLRDYTRAWSPARRACEDLRGGGSAYRLYCFVKD